VKVRKAGERKVAALLGGEHVPVPGCAIGDSPDFEHECLNIEVKSRRRLPCWLDEAIKQAETCQLAMAPVCTRGASKSGKRRRRIKLVVSRSGTRRRGLSRQRAAAEKQEARLHGSEHAYRDKERAEEDCGPVVYKTFLGGMGRGL
jgi:hypothetical protein